MAKFTGYVIGSLGLLNALSIFFKPVLFLWFEKLWAKHKTAYILKNGGKVIDGWVVNLHQDWDKDWCIEFKISQNSEAKVYSFIRSCLPDHLSDLDRVPILKVLKYKKNVYVL
jgi:hypothetical protein